MARPEKERKASTARMYLETIRLARTLASWKGVSMMDYLEQLVQEAAKRDGADLIRDMQHLVKDEPVAPPKKKA
jgi:hypothetical protein